MDIQHEIISFNPPTGSLLVRYFSDEVPDGLAYNIDIPLENGVFVGKEQIDLLVEAMKPVGQLERVKALRSAVVPPTLAAFVLPDPLVSQSPEQTDSIQTL